MDLSPQATELIFLTPVPANKMQLLHTTPYIHLRLDFQMRPRFSDCDYPVNLQHSRCKHVFSIRVENNVDRDHPD